MAESTGVLCKTSTDRVFVRYIRGKEKTQFVPAPETEGLFQKKTVKGKPIGCVVALLSFNDHLMIGYSLCRKIDRKNFERVASTMFSKVDADSAETKQLRRHNSFKKFAKQIAIRRAMYFEANPPNRSKHVPQVVMNVLLDDGFLEDAKRFFKKEDKDVSRWIRLYSTR